MVRKLFVDLHRKELSQTQQDALSELRRQNQDDWHAANELFAYQVGRDYTGYMHVTLVRHPAMRFISAYLNRIVLKQHDMDKIAQVLRNKYGPDYSLNYSFAQFLDYCTSIPFEQIGNSHFVPQTHLDKPLDSHRVISPYKHRLYDLSVWYQEWLGKQHQDSIKLDMVCKVESLHSDLKRCYRQVFAEHPDKLAEVLQMLDELPIHNATITGDEIIEDVIHRSADDLRTRGVMPSYQSFLSNRVLNQLADLFDQDFKVFNYKVAPSKATKRFEYDKAKRINDSVPSDFDWRYYVNANPDLPMHGIDNKADALNHWIHHGRFEDRQYHA